MNQYVVDGHYLFDPIFRQRIVYPQLEDVILYTDVEPPYTFINKLYVRNQEDDGYEYVTISEPCHGKTMRDVWLAANILYIKELLKNMVTGTCFLDLLSVCQKILTISTYYFMVVKKYREKVEIFIKFIYHSL